MERIPKQIIKEINCLIILHLGPAWAQPVQAQPRGWTIRLAPLIRLRRRCEKLSLRARYSSRRSHPDSISSSFATRPRAALPRMLRKKTPCHQPIWSHLSPYTVPRPRCPTSPVSASHCLPISGSLFIYGSKNQHLVILQSMGLSCVLGCGVQRIQFVAVLLQSI